MKLTASFLFALFVSFNTFGTPQIPDVIIMGGKVFYINRYPLEEYFKKYPDKRPDSEVISTGLGRGYIATFEITNKLLILKDVEVIVPTEDLSLKLESVFKYLFPDQEQIVADWFTGQLAVRCDKSINYAHREIALADTRYILFEFIEGNLVYEKKSKKRKYKEFKARQFETFSKTMDYRFFKWDLIRDKTITEDSGITEDSIDKFIQDHFTIYPPEILKIVTKDAKK